MKRINLLAPDQPERKTPRGRYVLLPIIIVLAIVMAYGSFNKIYMSAQDVARYKAELNTVKHELAGFDDMQAEMVSGAPEEVEMLAAIEAARNELEAMREVVDRQFRPVDWLTTLERLLPEDTWLDRIQGRGGALGEPEVVLIGTGMTSETVRILISRLEQLAPVMALEVIELKQEERPQWGQVTAFNLRLRLLPGRERFGRPWLEESEATG